MKTILKLMLLFSLMFCLEGYAQDPGPLASNNSFKGKRELRKEKKILRSERANTRRNERKVSQSTRDFAGTKFGTHKRPKKNKSKAAPAPTIDKDKPKG
jgi:hypothetical protein